MGRLIVSLELVPVHCPLCHIKIASTMCLFLSSESLSKTSAPLSLDDMIVPGCVVCDKWLVDCVLSLYLDVPDVPLISFRCSSSLVWNSLPSHLCIICCHSYRIFCKLAPLVHLCHIYLWGELAAFLVWYGVSSSFFSLLFLNDSLECPRQIAACLCSFVQMVLFSCSIFLFSGDLLTSVKRVLTTPNLIGTGWCDVMFKYYSVWVCFLNTIDFMVSSSFLVSKNGKLLSFSSFLIQLILPDTSTEFMWSGRNWACPLLTTAITLSTYLCPMPVFTLLRGCDNDLCLLDLQEELHNNGRYWEAHEYPRPLLVDFAMI